MTLSPWQLAAAQVVDLFAPPDASGPPPERFDTPGALAQRLDARTVQTPALDVIDEALRDLMATPDGRLIISMPPQEGKSERVTRRFVEWVLRDSPDTRITIASNTATLARRMGGIIRDDITTHRSLGLKLRPDLAARSEFQLLGHRGGVYSVGIGGTLTGRPVDLLVIDDPIRDRKQADSETHRETVWSWWTDVGSTRLAPGAPVVLVLTRWHEDDLAGRLLAAEDGHRWRVVNIPAQADHDPNADGTDQLGRQPGDFMQSARGTTVEQWQAKKIQAGSRTWASLFQGRPAPAEGDILKREWWRTYGQPLWLEQGGRRYTTNRGDEVIQSWDLAFKDTKGSDFVVGQVWLRRGVDCYLLDQVRARLDFVATVAALKQVTARWPQSHLKIVEDKANGPAVIASLQHEVFGIVPEEPQGSKQARASAVAPLIEAGNVYLPAPELAPWVGDYVEEAAAFPNGAHDDQVDATTQALNRLILQPLLKGTLDIVTEDDLDDELADFTISPY